jgi:hypothetical protein
MTKKGTSTSLKPNLNPVARLGVELYSQHDISEPEGSSH